MERLLAALVGLILLGAGGAALGEAYSLVVSETGWRVAWEWALIFPLTVFGVVLTFFGVIFAFLTFTGVKD